MKKRLPVLSSIRYSILLVALLWSSVPSISYAVDVDFFQSNDILYYDPGASGVTCSTTSSPSTNLDIPTVTGSDNAEKIWNFLKQEGFTDEQAAGIMGNIEQESGYNPDLTESNGVGYGIIQWSYGRRDALEAAAATKGVPVSDLGFQLGFFKQEASQPPIIMLHEDGSTVTVVSSTDNVWDALKRQTATNVESAAKYFHDTFERSGDYGTPNGIQNRINYAKKAYEKFTGKSASGGSSSGACSAAGSGDLIATLLEYAHPEYHENNYSGPVPPPKQAYLDIATKLTSEGKWVGGGQAEIGIPGIDCGGFVSILLTQSGFEPDYNFGLDMSRGSSNQEYGQLPWAKRNWKFLGNGGTINTSDLRPGDVAYSNGHTFIYVGQVNGFASQYASASYSWWRAPMAGGSFETATSPDYVWYGRREGTPPAYGTTKMSDPIPAGNDVNPGNSDWNGGE